MGARAEKWREQVEPHFRYLEDHGYTLVHSDDESSWETVVRYESPLNAVLVKLSVEFHRVEVELARLDNGELPPVEVWIGPDPSGRALLDNVVAARDPKRARWKRLNGIGRAATARALTFWASPSVRCAQTSWAARTTAWQKPTHWSGIASNRSHRY